MLYLYTLPIQSPGPRPAAVHRQSLRLSPRSGHGAGHAGHHREVHSAARGVQGQGGRGQEGLHYTAA